jgi:ribonuclease VapC
MVIDTSAVMAILQQEDEAEHFSRLIEGATVKLMSAGTALEAGILVESRRGRAGASELQNFILRAKIEIVPFDLEQVTIARDAHRRYGKGRHPAGLNMGDCFSYALARASGEPLLFKGEDFGRTDIQSCSAGTSPA